MTAVIVVLALRAFIETESDLVAMPDEAQEGGPQS
jgi:hypothetical protein